MGTSICSVSNMSAEAEDFLTDNHVFLSNVVHNNIRKLVCPLLITFQAGEYLSTPFCPDIDLGANGKPKEVCGADNWSLG